MGAAEWLASVPHGSDPVVVHPVDVVDAAEWLASVPHGSDPVVVHPVDVVGLFEDVVSRPPAHTTVHLTRAPLPREVRVYGRGAGVVLPVTY